MRGEEDDRQQEASGREAFLQIEATHVRHADVKQDASRHRGICGIKKFAAIGVGVYAQAHGLQQPLQRSPDAAIVIDDVDNRLGSFCGVAGVGGGGFHGVCLSIFVGPEDRCVTMQVARHSCQ